jgi:hypothetical protein
MQAFIDRLAADFPELHFTAGQAHYWCPATGEVFYKLCTPVSRKDRWSLLHEVSHGLLGHTAYKSDLELLHLEVSAWDKACELAQKYHLTISADYIQDCLDTYRDWLYRRCVCPHCGTQNLQSDTGNSYQCYNCHTQWHVSASRFSRSYRRSSATGQPVKLEPLVIFK